MILNIITTSIALICIIAFLIIFFKHSALKKEIKNIGDDLKRIAQEANGEKLRITLLDKNLESMTAKINAVIDSKLRYKTQSSIIKKTLKDAISNMSHDIRTPLTTIKGYTHILKTKDLSPSEKEDYLQIISHKIDYMENLLADFYELTLLDTQDSHISLQKINLSSLVEESILEKYDDFTKNNIQPQINLGGSSMFIYGEETSVKRIVDNLLTNALKYAQKDLTLTLSSTEEDVTFSTSNFCDFIKAEDAPRLFDRFYMADKARSSGGTGLGLSICKNLIEKLDGSISAGLNHNTLDINCTFKKYI